MGTLSKTAHGVVDFDGPHVRPEGPFKSLSASNDQNGVPLKVQHQVHR
jgi:hypothetical protein